MQENNENDTQMEESVSTSVLENTVNVDNEIVLNVIQQNKIGAEILKGKITKFQSIIIVNYFLKQNYFLNGIPRSIYLKKRGWFLTVN